MLEGSVEADQYEVGQIPDEDFRYYLLAEAFGWTPNQCDEVGAARQDWMLAIHNLVKKVKRGNS